MATKDPAKLREKQRRKRARRLARDPAYATATAERLRALRAHYTPNAETSRANRKRYRAKARAAKRDWSLAQKVAIAGRERPTACEVCGAEARIVFDHCHATDKFRGWICGGCNTALGHAHDSAHTLRKLAAYLEAFQARAQCEAAIAVQRKLLPRKPPYAIVTRDWLLVDSAFYGGLRDGNAHT